MRLPPAELRALEDFRLSQPNPPTRPKWAETLLRRGLNEVMWAKRPVMPRSEVDPVAKLRERGILQGS
jgi:hypothetical protein